MTGIIYQDWILPSYYNIPRNLTHYYFRLWIINSIEDVQISQISSSVFSFSHFLINIPLKEVDQQ